MEGRGVRILCWFRTDGSLTSAPCQIDRVYNSKPTIPRWCLYAPAVVEAEIREKISGIRKDSPRARSLEKARKAREEREERQMTRDPPWGRSRSLHSRRARRSDRSDCRQTAIAEDRILGHNRRYRSKRVVCHPQACRATEKEWPCRNLM